MNEQQIKSKLSKTGLAWGDFLKHVSNNPIVMDDDGTQIFWSSDFYSFLKINLYNNEDEI